MAADAVMINLALLTALMLRFMVATLFQRRDDGLTPDNQLALLVSDFGHSFWAITLICLLIFYLSGFYTYGRAYQSRYKAMIIVQAVSLSYLIYGFLLPFFSGEMVMKSRGAYILAWLLTIGLLVASRIWSAAWKRWVQPEQEALSKKNRSDKRVLVIGGAGYIGSALLPKLLEKGYSVRLLDQLLFGEDPIAPVLDHPKLEIIQGDFRHVEKVVEAMQDVDAVIHLGAIVGDPACSLDEDLTIDVNLSATRMIAELAKSAGVRRFIFASTCSVYGATEETLDERSVVRPISLYGHTKLASEKVLLGMASDEFRPTIVRFSTIYGLSGRTRFDLVVNLLAAKAKMDGKITVFGGDQWRPFVHVDDAALAVSMCLDAPLDVVGNQIYNVGADEQNYTITEIGRLVHEQVLAAELQINSDDTDKRNYRVSFAKIRNQLGFKPHWTVPMGITQVLEAISSGEVDDYTEARYSNVKFLKEGGTENFTKSNWAKELIREIAGERTSA
jgi:nucleoside-diphosphate-sugar epimerase